MSQATTARAAGEDAAAVDTPYIEQHRILSIQMLRALAIVMVACWHSALITGGRAGIDLDQAPALAFGFGGVDVFFVISGFICCLVTTRRPTSGGMFLARRAARILPFNILFSLPYLALLVVAPGIMHGRLDASFLLSSLVCVPDWMLVAGADPRPLIPSGWSLQNELLFYVMMALFLHGGQRRLAWILVALFGVGIVVHVGLYEWSGLRVNDFKFVSLYHLEFATGILAFEWRGRARAALAPILLVGAAVLTVLLALVLRAIGPADGSVPVTPFGWFGLVRVSGFSAIGLMLTLGALGAEPWLRRHARRAWVTVPVLIGEASFIFYLVHELGFGAVGKIVAPRLGDAPIALAVLTATTFLAALAFAIVFHLWIEKPGVRIMERWIVRRITRELTA